MTATRRILPASVALALVLVACGGGSDSSETDTVVDTTVDTEAEATEDFTPAEGESTADGTEEDVATTDAAVEETAPAATEAPAPAPTDAPAATDPDAGGDVGDAASAVVAALSEWEIEAPTEYAAGEVTFTATNNGSFPHELVVIQGEGYESLPLADGGAVLEDDLPTGALIGRTARVGGGASEDLTVTLAPGNYVLVCNLGSGGTSHAGRGQRLDITVS